MAQLDAYGGKPKKAHNYCVQMDLANKYQTVWQVKCECMCDNNNNNNRRHKKLRTNDDQWVSLKEAVIIKA
eukprot:11889534-Karenia_brevis.AAC.1